MADTFSNSSANVVGGLKRRQASAVLNYASKPMDKIWSWLELSLESGQIQMRVGIDEAGQDRDISQIQVGLPQSVGFHRLNERAGNRDRASFQRRSAHGKKPACGQSQRAGHGRGSLPSNKGGS